MYTLGERLRKARKNAGVSLGKIQYKTGIGETKLYHWEKDINPPTFEGVIKLAELYGCSLDYLAGNEVEKMRIDVDKRKYYIEIDQIRLIYEDDELVGWYRP